LARQAIARRLDHQRATGTLDRQLADAREANATLRGQLDVLRDKRAAARTKLTILSAQQAAAAAQRQALASSRSPATHTKALARFERFYEQVELAQAEAVALLELETDADTLLESQFDRQETERAIDAELAQLKACHPSAPQ
jgi:phage shock protein A